MKLPAAFGIAVAQLRHRWVRALLGVVGVGVAVLATVLLLSLGVSVLDVGDAGFSRIGGDLWVTGGGVGFAPGAVGGVEPGLLGAHDLAGDVERHQGVEEARALGFQAVYVGTEPGEYETLVGAGITGDGDVFDTTEGRSFRTADSHYANGSYDGQMTGEVLVDRRAAAQLGVGVGDTLHVGGTIDAADAHEFEVVGISNDVARYIGAPTVMLQLGELQRVSSQTRSDPAAAIVVAVEDDDDVATVQRELQADLDGYHVRTNDEQFRAVLQRQSTTIASGLTVVVLAIAGGVALVSNVLGLFVYQQRRQLAALRAIGVSTGLLLRVVLLQGVAIAAAGAALGLAATLPAVRGVNRAVQIVVGFEDIIAAPTWALGVGGGLALSMGIGGAVVAGWLVARVEPMEHLDR